MESIFFIAGIWLLISVTAAIVSYHLDISIALVEICIGVAAAAVADHLFGQGSLGSSQQWVQFLASIGAVLLTFLAGAELDPVVIRTKLRDVSVVGLVGFVAPFAGGTAVANFVLGWTVPSAFLGGIALSTTSMAVVYAVMLETGLNRTEYGKGILGVRQHIRAVRVHSRDHHAGTVLRADRDGHRERRHTHADRRPFLPPPVSARPG